MNDGRDDADVRNAGGEPAAPVVIPHARLAPATLQAVIEAFVLREGTNYGLQDYSLAQKVAQVMLQLERGQAQVMFDPETASVGITLV